MAPVSHRIPILTARLISVLAPLIAARCPPFRPRLPCSKAFRLSLAMPKDLQTLLQRTHDVQSKLEETERDLAGIVLSVSCRFCSRFGHEAKPGAERKHTTSLLVFRRPSRTGVYKRHHVGTDPETWKRFLHCSVQEKTKLCDGQNSYASTLRAKFESTFDFNAQPRRC